MALNTLQEKLGLLSLGLLSTFTFSAFFVQKEAPSPVLESEVETRKLSSDDQDIVNLVNELTERLANQEKVDRMIQGEVESGYYTAENPLVILDPYTQSPLTALICFTTEEPTRVEIHVEGEDEYTQVNHGFSELSMEHIIPVYGLYPDKLNTVTISVLSEEGTVIIQGATDIQTEPIPEHYQNLIILTETFQEGYHEGINYLYEGSFKFAFDKSGQVRWFFSSRNFLPTSEYVFTDNKFVISKGSHLKDVLIYTIDKLGKIYDIYYSPYGAHHEISPTTSGNLLVGGSNIKGSSIEDFIYEIDVNTGDIVNTLDFKYVLQRNREAWMAWVPRAGYNYADWMHVNSIEYNEYDNTIIVSSNHQSAVVKVSWPHGDIQWILSTHNDWSSRLQPYLLEPIGNNFEFTYNQHAVEILPDYDNDPNTIDILLFDNGANRFYQDDELQRKIKNNEVVAPDLYSRMVHYRVNEVTMEVEQIWQYGKERGLNLFSASRGDADLLENGNILGVFLRDITENVRSSPIILEVTDSSDLVWEAELLSNSSTGLFNVYRAERLPFYFDDDAEHDIYSTARNLIPEDIMAFVENYNQSQ